MPNLLEIAQAETIQKKEFDYSIQIDGNDLPFPSGSFVVIGGRPAMGKTTLMLQFLLMLCEKYSEKLLFISGEHSVELLYRRIKSIVTCTPIELLHSLGDEPFASYPVLSSENCTIESIGYSWNQAKELIMASDAKFIFLDYIQLFLHQKEDDHQYENNKMILEELKYLAEQRQMVIIAASQLSRKADKRASKKPQISDLRKHYPLDELADIIMMLYRPAYYGFTEDEHGNNIRNQAILSLLKSNYSQLFDMKLAFDNRIPCFSKMELSN